MKAGAYDFVGKPIDIDRLAMSIGSAVDAARKRTEEASEQARVLKLIR